MKIILAFFALLSFSFAVDCPTSTTYNGMTGNGSSTARWYSDNSTGGVDSFLNLMNGSVVILFKKVQPNYYCSYTLNTNSCPEGTFLAYGTTTGTDIVNLRCESICNAGEVWKNGSCVPKNNCGYGYSPNSDGGCKPDKDCPTATMSYTANESSNFKGCTPRQDLSPDECANAGGIHASLGEDLSSQSSAIAMKYGKGCWDKGTISYMANSDTASFLASGLLPKADLTPLANLGKALFSGGKNLLDDVLNFFKGKESLPPTNEPKLLTYQPEIIDIEIAPNGGTYANMNYKERTAIFDELNGNQYARNVEPITVSDSAPNPQNVYKGNDITVVEDNYIGTNSYVSSPKPFTVPENTPVNTAVADNITLNSNLSGTKTQNFPVQTVLQEKVTTPAGEIKTTTVSRIAYPDGSYTDVITRALQNANGTTYQMTTTTPVQTQSGTVTYQQETAVTTNASGQVTNTVTSPATIAKVQDSGHTTNLPNVTNPATLPTTPTTPTGTKNETSPINLSNIQASLNRLNQTASNIEAQIKNAVEYKSPNLSKFEQMTSNAIQRFNEQQSALDTAFNYANTLKDIFATLQQNLDDMLALFNDKPVLSFPSGDCGFSVNAYNQTYIANPCQFVEPYRPILVIFFTFYLSVAVFIFALKYLFDVRMGGN